MAHEYLPRFKFLRAREMAAEGQSLTAISAELALTEPLVQDILDDRIQPSRIVVEDHEPFREEILTATRCPGCGSLVYTRPCLACAMSGDMAPQADAPRLGGIKLKEKLQRMRTRQARKAA